MSEGKAERCCCRGNNEGGRECVCSVRRFGLKYLLFKSTGMDLNEYGLIITIPVPYSQTGTLVNG